MGKPKHLFVINDKFHVHSDDEKSLTLQQGDLLGRENERDRCIFIDRQNATLLRAALGDWLAAGEPIPAGKDPAEDKVAVMLSQGGSPPLVILGMSQAAWDYCKDGRAHTFDLSSKGVPVQIVIAGGPTRAEVIQNVAAGVERGGGEFDRDKGQAGDDLGIRMPKTH